MRQLTNNDNKPHLTKVKAKQQGSVREALSIFQTFANKNGEVFLDLKDMK